MASSKPPDEPAASLARPDRAPLTLPFLASLIVASPLWLCAGRSSGPRNDRLRARRAALQAIIDAHQANRTTAVGEGQHR